MGRFMVLLAIACVIFTGSARACSCTPGGASFGDEYTSKDYIFLGRVMTMRGGGGKVSYQFKVEKIFKGEVPKSFVYTVSTQSCGYSGFTVGMTYLVYGSADVPASNGMGISECSRTQPASGADDEIRALEGLSRK